MTSMKISSATNAQNIRFKSMETKPKTATTVSKEPQKDGKKKLALALAGLAAIGIAAIVIANGKKPAAADNNKVQNSLNEAANTCKEKIKGLVKKENLPFDDSTKTILDKNNEIFATKDTYAKYKAQYKGKDAIVEEKMISSENLRPVYGHYAFIKDPETGKILDVKRLTLEGDEIIKPASRKAAEGNILKTTENLINESGNKVKKTYKNGKLHSTQTTVLNPDNSRQIIIEYADKGSKGYKKIINIATDSTKTITEEGKRFLDL